MAKIPAHYKDKVGKRINLNTLLCVGISHYEGAYGTVYRHKFIGIDGTNFVYSGSFLKISETRYYDVSATIKKLDTDFNMVRLARVRVTRRLPEFRERELL